MTSKRKSWRDVLPVHLAADMFPLMSEAELRELGEDIKKNGLREPIAIYRDDVSHYSLLDGRNRLDAMELVGVEFELALVKGRGGRSDYWDLTLPNYDGFGTPTLPINEETDDPYGYVISANIYRRHLTAEQKRELIDKLLKADPTKSDRAIAKVVKASDKTVGKRRRKLEGRADIPHVKSRTDTKGRAQPAKKKIAKVEPKPTPAIAPTATTTKSWKVEVIAKDGKRYGNSVRLATQDEADAFRANASFDLMREKGIIVTATEVIPCGDAPSGAFMKRGRNGHFTGRLSFMHGTCGTLEWEEITAAAKVEPKPKVQRKPTARVNDGTDDADEANGPQQFWERSLSAHASDAIALEAFWTRQHGAAWRDFPVSRDLATLAREAADAWNSLSEQLDARVVSATAPATAADDYPDMPEFLKRAPKDVAA
jgi:hypothetical protein